MRIMFRMRTAIATLVGAALCLITPAAALPPIGKSNAKTCSARVSFPMLDATTGRPLDGSVQVCDGTVIPSLSGGNALTPGQQLFLVQGRTLSGQWKIGSFVRAFPNRAYPIHSDNPQIQDGGTVRWGRTPSTSWENVPVLLPFVPTTVGSFARDGHGDDEYGYANLIPLPGHEAEMAPLNAQSIIIGVGGVSFAGADGLQAYLGGLASGVSWVEVLYAQRDEAHLQIRRAFLPLIPRARGGAAWTALVRQHPLAQPSYGSMSAAYAFIGLGLSALAAGFLAVRDQPSCHQENVTLEDGIRRSYVQCN